MIDALSSGSAHTLSALYSNYVLTQAQRADKVREFCGLLRASAGYASVLSPLRYAIPHVPARAERLVTC